MRAVLAALLLFALPAHAQETLAPEPAASVARDVSAYRAALEEIAAALERGDVETARGLADTLAAEAVAFGDERLPPDPVALAAVKKARPEQAVAVARRVRAVADALGATESGSAPAPDPALVERLRGEGRLREGGDVPSPNVPAVSIPERIAQAIFDVLQWIGERIEGLIEWLRKLWPKRAAGGEAATSTVTLTLVLVTAALCVLVILAVRTVRRSRAATAAATEARRATPAADEDPLSRESDEWERYARELGAAGRRREAIRAWYHAVLAALFRRGLLEPRKGRTNWEHVASLSADLGWRPSFVQITREFEREWYGRDESAPDALVACSHLAGGLLRDLRAEAAA